MCLPNWQRIQVYQKSDWVIVSLHRPHVLNALNRALLEELNQVLDWLENQKRFRVLIITGTGEKSFSAGADIEEFSKISSAWAAREWLEYVHRIFQRIEDFPIPVIMAVNGYALGGGCELAMCGDIIFAAEHAQFGQPEIDLGFMPGYGGTQRMTRLIGQSMTKYLCMTGEKFRQRRHMTWGLSKKSFLQKNFKRRQSSLRNGLRGNLQQLFNGSRKRSTKVPKRIYIQVSRLKRHIVHLPFNLKTVKKGCGHF